MAETFTGRVHNGVVVFEDGAAPAEGTLVRVLPVESPAGGVNEADPMAKTRAWLLVLAREAERLAPDLPADLAVNHDHYAHGKSRS